MVLTRVPRPGEIRPSLLKVLARRTNFTPHQFIQNTEILEEILEDMGFDPKDLPEDFDMKSRSRGGAGAGFERNVSLSFRLSYRDKKPPLTVKGPTPGLWGITEQGLEEAVALLGGWDAVRRPQMPQEATEATVPLPRPRIFNEPLLKALGKLSGHRADVGVGHNQVIPLVLEYAGFDPNHLPTGWAIKGSNNSLKIHDRIRWAVKGMKESTDPWIGQPVRGQWCLTPAGLAVARDLNGVTGVTAPAVPLSPPKPSGPNETAQWLNVHMTPKPGEKRSVLHRKMLMSLSRKFPNSVRFQFLEDHIQNFMLRLIRRNSLAKHIAQGEVHYGKIVAYCLNSARSDIRDSGMDPGSRELYGARTEKEHKEATGDEPVVIPVTLREQMTAEVPKLSAEMEFDETWARIQELVREAKPGAWKRYASILVMKMQGWSVKEIARKEGVSPHRASAMIADARRCVREGFEAGDFDA